MANKSDPPRSLPLSELVAYLDELLDARSGRDYAPNGLQVEGRNEVGKVVTGVSACLELFERAAAAGADAVLVHHGLFWSGDDRALIGVRYRRVKALIDSGMSLLAYHLPLDRHAELGNNAVGLRRLEVSALQPFGDLEGQPVGFRGRFAPPVARDELVRRCTEVFGQTPQIFGDGPDPIASVALVSGAAEKLLYEAIDLGLDAFITGEVSEWVPNLAREAGVHFLAAGHYATERLGVERLGKHLAERFGIEAEFVDVPNPV